MLLSLWQLLGAPRETEASPLESDYCGKACASSDNCSHSVLPGACIVCFPDRTCGGCDCSCGGECKNSSECTGECSVCFPALSGGKGKCGVGCGQHCMEDWHCLSPDCGNCVSGFCRKKIMTDDNDLPTLLHIDWRRLPDFPAQGHTVSGLEASNGGWVDGAWLSAFGYASGGGSDFMNTSWLLNVSDPGQNSSATTWQRLPDAPVSGRQDVGCTVIGDAAYFVGGFSYSSPYTYTDTLKLARTSAGWGWTRLADFPHPIDAYSAVVSINETMYVVGGADYDPNGFYAAHDRNGGTVGLGSRMYSLDTQKGAAAQWQRLPSLPSTPRWIASVSAVGDSIVVIGGATGSNPQHSITTLVDNWKYDVWSQSWTRLPNLPIASGNFPSDAVFDGRYILLIGGFQYDNVTLPNGTEVPSYGTPQQMCGSPISGSHPERCRRDCKAVLAHQTTREYDVVLHDCLMPS